MRPPPRSRCASRPAPSLEARELLESQIEQRSAEADAIQADITTMTDEIATLQEELLGDEGQPRA